MAIKQKSKQIVKDTLDSERIQLNTEQSIKREIVEKIIKETPTNEKDFTPYKGYNDFGLSDKQYLLYDIFKVLYQNNKEPEICLRKSETVLNYLQNLK